MANQIHYLNNLVDYYGIGQTAAHAHYRQPVYGGGFMPAVNLAGGGYPAGGNVVFMGGGVAEMREARQYQKEDREEARATSSAWIGGILTIAGAALGAFVLKSYFNNKEALGEAIEFRNNELPHLQFEVRRQLTPIVAKHIDNLKTKISQGRNIILLTAGALACAASAFAGGMMSVQWLITAAIVGGVAIASIGVFLAVWCCLSKTDLPENYKRQIEVLYNLQNRI